MSVSTPTAVRRLIAGVSAAALVLSISPAAVAQPEATAPPGQFLDTDAVPRLGWSVPSRYDASWSAWNSSTATYTNSVINPLNWSVNLDGCASTSRRRITGFTFTVQQPGTAWQRTFATPNCALRLRNVLPAQGYYRVTLTLHTTLGVSTPLPGIIAIKDYLIVSIGDSLASGEGNPDRPGSYDVIFVAGKAVSVSTNTAARWKDRRCHRSARSGPALAAKAYEDADPKTSVTFVSVACSGAEILDLVSARYRGIEPIGASTVPPQVDAVADLVGPNSPRGGRQIDALLVSAGLNDLHFGDIVERCASNTNGTSCVTEGGIADQVTGLPLKYAQLAGAIRQKLPSTREVYLNNYPSYVFHGGGCGVLGHAFFGISAAEGAEMAKWGNALSRKIVNLTDIFRNEPFRWNRVNDLARPFFPHAYCDRVPWFVSYRQSFLSQGNKYGTAHPNASGHLAYASLIRQAMVPDQVGQAYRRLVIHVNSLRAAAVAGTPQLSVALTLRRYQNDPFGFRHVAQVRRNGGWTAVPASVGTFSLDVYRSPSSPRHAIALSMDVGHVIPITGALTDAYGAGRHVRFDAAGRLAVDYTVDVLPPTAVAGDRLAEEQVPN